jgi:hypothetical protein
MSPISPALDSRARATQSLGKRRLYIDLEPWFPVPHYLADDLARIVPGPHFKVLIWLFRKIAGWRKESDLISLSQIQESAGVSRKVAVECLRIFQDAGIIGKRRGMGPRGINRIFLIPKADPVRVTSVVRRLVEKGKKGRLRFTQGASTHPRNDLSTVHGVNTQKERSKRIGKDAGGVPAHSTVTPEAENELGKSEFFHELARIAGKKTSL